MVSPSMMARLGVSKIEISAPALGAGGRRFESFHPDSLIIRRLQNLWPPFLLIYFVCLSQLSTFENN